MRTVRKRREDGAALVEFAVVAPLLILLVLGIVEFGWLFGQFNDVRHGAREGARFAAVDGGSNTEIRDVVCTSMDGLDAGMTLIEVDLAQVESFDQTPDNPSDAHVIGRGDTGQITVTATVSALSGAPLITDFLPSTLTSSVEFRIEQDPSSWTTESGLTCS